MQNAGEEEQDTPEREAARAEHLEKRLFSLALSRGSWKPQFSPARPHATQGTHQRPGGLPEGFFSNPGPDFQGNLLQLQHCRKT